MGLNGFIIGPEIKESLAFKVGTPTARHPVHGLVVSQLPLICTFAIVIMVNTGCLAVGVTTLILNNFLISGPIIKPFNSMKVKTIRICLVYKTPCKV